MKLDSSGTGGETYVKGTKIKWGALISTILGAFVVFFSNAYIAIISTFVSLNVWIISGTGTAAARAVKVVLGQSAALQVTAWSAAFSQAVQAGPLAPFVMAAEVLAVITIAVAIWKRRPIPT